MQIKKMYSIIKPQGPKVPWKRITCNNQASPKSTFISWLAILDRLVTENRLLVWQIPCDPCFFFCAGANEIVNHLFFDCSYSKVIWSSMIHVLGFTRHVLSFAYELQWIVKYCRKTDAKRRLIMMCFSETDYNVWL
ncbi:uncharacterized protein LOC110694011 [Chenopodium quinoa]|uniref:uncharacterized protein LOC110694011 n=1 Tax=Chenopodium quinoa TaxID=63459 RepID=UPI000B7789E7|nr:uncharacterized protein LOC110694011 [Chenopodium quinoa]